MTPLTQSADHAQGGHPVPNMAPAQLATHAVLHETGVWLDTPPPDQTHNDAVFLPHIVQVPGCGAHWQLSVADQRNAMVYTLETATTAPNDPSTRFASWMQSGDTHRT